MIIYPPTLDIQAGGGGIKVDQGVTLFPSAYGELNLTTTGGGSLTGSSSAKQPDLVMSDSDATRYYSSDATVQANPFAYTVHAAVPVQLLNPNPVVLDISGDLNGFWLVTPKETQITVNGNMNNSYFTAQNLHASDVSFLNVGGQIFDRNNNTFITLSAPLSDTVSQEINESAFLGSLYGPNLQKVFTSGSLSAPQFYYTPGGLQVAVEGKITPAQYAALVKTDANGNPVSLQPLYLQLVINGVPQTDPVTGAAIVDTAHPVIYLDPGHHCGPL